MERGKKKKIVESSVLYEGFTLDEVRESAQRILPDMVGVKVLDEGGAVVFELDNKKDNKKSNKKSKKKGGGNAKRKS